MFIAASLKKAGTSTLTRREQRSAPLIRHAWSFAEDIDIPLPDPVPDHSALLDGALYMGMPGS
jgi:hypothetical protein